MNTFVMHENGEQQFTYDLLGAGHYVDLDGQDTYVVTHPNGSVVAYTCSKADAEMVTRALNSVRRCK